MAPLQTNQGSMSKDMVTRVGSAAGRVARIQQDYTIQADAEMAADAREALAARARAAAERVIDEEGITIQDYNKASSRNNLNSLINLALFEGERCAGDRREVWCSGGTAGRSDVASLGRC